MDPLKIEVCDNNYVFSTTKSYQAEGRENVKEYLLDSVANFQHISSDFVAAISSFSVSSLCRIIPKIYRDGVM